MRGLDKTDLSTYNPPKELIEKARQMRTDADSKKKRSIETGFKEYLKANPCSKDMNSDQIKEALLLNYMALQLKAKSSETSLKGSHEARTTTGKHIKKHWWNPFQMDRELGPDVGPFWRESGNIVQKCCPVTRSTEPKHCIWGVPELWEQLDETDMKALKLETERAAEDGDADMLNAFTIMNGKVAQDIADDKDPLAASSSNDTQVKVEQKTPDEILKEKMIFLQSSCEVNIRKYQDMKTDCTVLLGKCEPDKKACKYAGMLHADLLQLLEKHDAVIKVFETMLRKKPQDKDLKRLVADSESLDTETQDSIKWGGNFGYVLSSAKPAKRRRQK